MNGFALLVLSRHLPAETEIKQPLRASLSIGGTTVVDCLQRARAAAVGWPLPEELSDAALEARLFPASTALATIKSRRTQADWPAIHRELKRPGVC